MAETRKLGFGPIAAPAGGVLVVFADDGVHLGAKTKALLGPAADLVARAAKSERFTGKSGSALDIVAPAGLKATRLIVVGTGKAADRKPQDLVKLGGTAMGRVPSAASEATLVLELGDGAVKPDAAADMALGATLRGYAFDRYKTKRKEGDERPSKAAADARGRRRRRCAQAWSNRQAVADGVVLARDLVNEPPNVLYPAEFARRAAALRKLGVGIEVLDVKAMRKLGMGALLGVGQGSAHDSRLVVMRWNGGKKGTPPVAFIGKGVCFDTGGISIKPAAGMEDMKGDMAGAGLRRRADARARRPQGQGQRDRRDRPGREHAGRQRAAPGRHRHLDVRPDHRDHQHRRRRPARARRRRPLRQHASSSRNS